jgi:hypothetical protein
VREGFAQSRVALGLDQFMVGRRSLLLRDVLSVQDLPGCPGRVLGAPGRAAFPRVVAAWQLAIVAGLRAVSSWSTSRSQTLWADVVGVGAAELVAAAGGPDQRGVPLDE